MTAPRVLIRADASLQIGSGHVMRCLSLAAALRARGAEVHFASRELPGHLHAAVRAQGYPLHVLPAPTRPPTPREDLAHAAWLGVDEAQDRDDTAAVLTRIGRVAALVVDHYALDARWQAALRPAADCLLVIDDLADRDHAADLLLDQNLGADGERYRQRVPAGCIGLFGPAYALLRAEFSEMRTRLRARDGTLRQVLVSLGGVDAEGHTEVAIEALARLQPPPRVDVVLGAANPRAAAVAERCRTLGFDCAQNVTDMAARMAAADLAVGAGGSSSWERACLGLPSLIVVAADNQRRGAQALVQAGWAWAVEGGDVTVVQLESLLRELAAQPQTLRDMGQRSLDQVDGKGAARVARLLLPPAITLRAAVAADSDDLHHWRNHEQTRRHSHSSAVIPRADHERWLAAVLANPQRDLLIAAHQGQPVGVLRYDCAGDEAVVSIYLVPGHAGGGFGPAILRAGSGWLARARPGIARIRAEIHDDNAASHKAFREAGYTLRGKDYFQDLIP